MGKVLYLPATDSGKANSEAIRQAMKPRRRWNWRKAAGNMLTLAGIVAAGLFLAYLLLSWLAGVPW